MSEMPLTPEQFARLLSLAPDHPDRVAWSGRPEFESMRALYEKFEGADPSSVSDRALREAEGTLERRFRDELSGADATGPRAIVGPGRRERPWWSMRAPAFALAAAMVVVVAGVWLTARPRSTTLRGAEDTPVILEPRRVSEDLEIRWTPVAEAASYRISFVDSSMREIAAIEAWPETAYRLKASALPPGLVQGAHVFVQIQPVRGGGAVGAAGTRAIIVP